MSKQTSIIYHSLPLTSFFCIGFTIKQHRSQIKPWLDRVAGKSGQYFVNVITSRGLNKAPGLTLKVRVGWWALDYDQLCMILLIKELPG